MFFKGRLINDRLSFQIQGAIIVASVIQVIIGATGTMGFLLRYIGPLTITPSISLIGLSLFDVGADHACKYYLIHSNSRFIIAKTLGMQHYIKSTNGRDRLFIMFHPN